MTALIVAMLYGCKQNEFDAFHYGKTYCDCVEKNRKQGLDFFEAKAKCEGELLSSNRFYRITYIEDHYGRYMMFLPLGLRDSAATFKTSFIHYLEKNCCKDALMGCDHTDSLQIKRK